MIAMNVLVKECKLQFPSILEGKSPYHLANLQESLLVQVNHPQESVRYRPLDNSMWVSY